MDNNEQCIICDAFDDFDALLNNGVEIGEAFHTVVDKLLEEVSHGIYKEGLLDALTKISESIDEDINTILDDCDCEECTCGRFEEQ